MGQSVTGTASPLSTVRVQDGEPDWTSIEGIVAAWKPDGLVVGEPLHMDGRPQLMTRRAGGSGTTFGAGSGSPCTPPTSA